jgi:hypothetical protein
MKTGWNPGKPPGPMPLAKRRDNPLPSIHGIVRFHLRRVEKADWRVGLAERARQGTVKADRVNR